MTTKGLSLRSHSYVSNLRILLKLFRQQVEVLVVIWKVLQKQLSYVKILWPWTILLTLKCFKQKKENKTLLLRSITRLQNCSMEKFLRKTPTSMLPSNCLRKGMMSSMSSVKMMSMTCFGILWRLPSIVIRCLRILMIDGRCELVIISCKKI